MNRYVGLLLAALIPAVTAMEDSIAAEAERHPMRIEDLLRFQRLADPQISPDGKLVAYVVTTVDLPGNRTATHLWLAPTDPSQGAPRQLTTSGKKDKHPRWSPDGKQLLFESNRSGDFQLWSFRYRRRGSQLTTITTEAANGCWSPDGKWIALSRPSIQFSEAVRK